MDLLIRFAKMEDAEELLALYTPYVTDTVITTIFILPLFRYSPACPAEQTYAFYSSQRPAG